MSAALEPLLQKLVSLAPLFGRAREDIDAMVSRGRSGDFKGVMQNARLVVETLLRSMVTDELKQTPGKAMLDELVTKFRQQSNAGLVPTNILAHMGTVQAWGNLSSHDHAGSLADAPVSVGEGEVVASLNSVVAILSWYAQRKNLTPVQGSTPVERTPAPRRSPALVWPALGLLAILGSIGAWAVLRKPSPPSFEALDAVYASWHEPPPPAACRDASLSALLARAATDVEQLRLIETPTAESAYLIARASFEERKQKAPELSAALACPAGFAAAEHLAAEVAIAEEDLPGARKHLERARALAPGFLDARAKLAGVMLQQRQVSEALAEAEALIKAAPEFHPAYLVRFAARAQSGDPEGAMKDLCTARRLGSKQAREKLEEAHASCD